jgi:hypothetical protein
MSLGTGFAFPYDNVPLNNTSLQIAGLFLLFQGYVLFAGFTMYNTAEEDASLPLAKQMVCFTPTDTGAYEGWLVTLY